MTKENETIKHQRQKIKNVNLVQDFSTAGSHPHSLMVRCPSEGGHIPGDAGSNPSGTHYVCRQRSLELIGVLFRKICLLTFFSNYLFFIELFSKRDTPFLIDARRDDRTVLCYFEHNFLLNFLSCKIFCSFFSH